MNSSNDNFTSTSELELTKVQTAVITMLYSTTILVALIGNVLVIFIVSKRPETRTLTGFLFVNMAAADLMVTLLDMPISMALAYTDIKWLPGIIGQITCKIVFFIFLVSIEASILSLTFMAIDRFLGVVFPFHRFPKLRSVKLLSLVIWWSSMILMIPAAVLYKIEKFDGLEETYCLAAFLDVFGDFEKGVMIFYSYIFLLNYLIPLLVISVLYGLVCRKLWRKKKQTYRLSSGLEIAKRQKATKRIVRTLVIITAAFALCWLPAQGYHLLMAFNIDLHLYRLPRYAMFVCLWSGHANSALNPWLYMFLTDKFRVALIDVMHGRCCDYRAKSYLIRETISMRRRHHDNEQENDRLNEQVV